MLLALSVLFFFPLTVFAQESSEGWERLTDMPQVRSEMAAAAIGDKVYVMGGLNSKGEATNTVFIYDIKEDIWSLGTPMPLSLHHAGVSSLNEKL